MSNDQLVRLYSIVLKDSNNENLEPFESLVCWKVYERNSFIAKQEKDISIAHVWAREALPRRYVRLDSTSFFQETSATRNTSRTWQVSTNNPSPREWRTRAVSDVIRAANI